MSDEVELTVVPADPVIAINVPPVKPAKAKRKLAKKAPAKAKGAKKAKGKAAKPVRKAKANRAPRTRDVSKLDAFGFRKGSIKSQAATMYQAGATLADVKDTLGSVQFNVLTELEAKGFTIKTKALKAGNGRKLTFYKVSKTKGARS
jgi:hypothetical protein